MGQILCYETGSCVPNVLMTDTPFTTSEENSPELTLSKSDNVGIGETDSLRLDCVMNPTKLDDIWGMSVKFFQPIPSHITE